MPLVSPGTTSGDFAELHARYWPEVTMVATLRQIPDEAPEPANG